MLFKITYFHTKPFTFLPSAFYLKSLSLAAIMSDNRYNQRGVSASKEDVHAAIKNIE